MCVAKAKDANVRRRSKMATDLFCFSDRGNVQKIQTFSKGEYALIIVEALSRSESHPSLRILLHVMR